MSRRGHLYGMISTYHNSWFLKSDGKGNVCISNAVGADVCGDAEHTSVTEVCPLHFLYLTLGVIPVLQHVMHATHTMHGGLLPHCRPAI